MIQRMVGYFLVRKKKRNGGLDIITITAIALLLILMLKTALAERQNFMMMEEPAGL